MLEAMMKRQNQNKINMKGLEEARKHHIASLGVLHESGTKLHSGLNELSQAYNEHMGDMFQSTMEALKAISSAKSPQDALKIQKDWVQESMKVNLEKSSHLSKQAVEVMKEASKPAQDFAKETSSKLKKAGDKVKAAGAKAFKKK